MYSLTQLRCFVAIAEEQHFGRAAARLHLTQPPLSRHLALLEDELGVKLLNRSSHGVSLTVAGGVFLRDARQLLRDVDQSAASARLAAIGQLGHLAIGFTASAAYELLPTLIRSYRERNPQVGLSLKELVTRAQVELLLEGKLDVALVRPSTDMARFGSLRMNVDRLIVAIPSNHPLASRAEIRLEDFHGQPFIGHSPTEAAYFSDITTALFRRHGIEPITVQLLAQPHAQLAMVRAGIGFAIVTDLVRRYSVDSHIAFRELDRNAEVPPIELWLIHRTDASEPALLNLIQCAREMAQAVPRAIGNLPPVT